MSSNRRCSLPTGLKNAASQCPEGWEPEQHAPAQHRGTSATRNDARSCDQAQAASRGVACVPSAINFPFHVRVLAVSCAAGRELGRHEPKCDVRQPSPHPTADAHRQAAGGSCADRRERARRQVINTAAVIMRVTATSPVSSCTSRDHRQRASRLLTRPPA
jgi:hypothetical protein